MFKKMFHNEQEMCERRLIAVMRRLKIDDSHYNFNWNRSSCYIEFQYKENMYRMEHSVESAKEKGIVILRNGLDCLSELVRSLEDLCQITERGTHRLETWLSGMKQSSPEEEMSEFLEEVHIRYKSVGKQKHSDYMNMNDEVIQVEPEPSLNHLNRNRINLQSQDKS
ncbi:hypothetical protein [Alkalihalobacterium chitinilyticum]|uniref:Uncharacterized protein n=1 Tax=Alkalihalobacterium chitinilyticum TaxID=2980103 RepID=A0ABT5VFW6_9BACI|nr:hypothetical protein [Alkalihalobacterium chitinilyticum]MDE5414336.1 hypothetical protein [Alkalihalobacterium chitinilyticum]